MRVVKKIFVFLGLIIFIALILIFSREYFVKKPKKEVYLEESLEEKSIIEKEKIPSEVNISTKTPPIEILEKEEDEIVKKPVLLFNFPILFPEIKYPEIYGYDPQSKTVRIYNIEEKNYQELYKGENIEYLLFSKDTSLFYIKSDKKFFLINRLSDKKYTLPYFTKKVFFKENTPYIFILTLSGGGYLAEFVNNEKKFLDIFILNPDIDFLSNGFLIAENLKSTLASPLYFKTHNNTELFLSPKSNLSFITNKNNLAFVSYVDRNWKSILIDSKNNILKEFNFGTLKEKCSFEEILICAIPKKQEFNKVEDWYYLKESFNDDIIVFNPQNNNFKVVKIDGDFDIIKPTITPLGIIFFNRNDAFIYFLSKDNLSF